MFAITLLSAVISFWSQHQAGAVATLSGVPLSYRFMNSLQAVVNYLVDFSGWGIYVLFYPHVEWMSVAEILSLAALVLAISAITLWFYRRHPALATGWLWFLLFLLPVIGLVQVGSQSRADRYMYLPMIGLIWMLAYLGESLWRLLRPAFRPLIPLAAVIWIFALSIRTHLQVSYWKTTFLIANQTIQNVGDDPMAVSILASALARNADWDRAIPLLLHVVKLQPNNSSANLNLALGLFRTGKREDAILLAETVRAREPENLSALSYLTNFYRDIGDVRLSTQRRDQYNQVARSQGVDPLPLTSSTGSHQTETHSSH